jgi:hypothetical protein
MFLQVKGDKAERSVRLKRELIFYVIASAPCVDQVLAPFAGNVGEAGAGRLGN